MQLAKRRAKSLGKRASFSATTDGPSAGPTRLALLKSTRGGICKVVSQGGGLDKLVQAQLLQEQQQVLLQPHLQQLQPQITQEGGQGTEEEEDVKARLTRKKQQLANMEQHLAVLQQQQHAETQLAAMHQHYGQLLHQHTHFVGMPLHVSGPDLAAMHNSSAFAAAAAGAMAAAPVDSASAPISAVHKGAHTAFVPLLGAMQGWHMAGGGAVPQQEWPAAGFSANLPPIGNSNSALLPLVMPHHAMLPVPAAAAATGLSAPMPRLASLPGRLPPAGCVPDSRTVNSSAAGSSQPLPAAVHSGPLTSSQSAGAVAGARAGAGAQPQHIPCLHVDDIALLLEDGNDVPDLEAFLAAGGNLLQEEGHTSGQLSSSQHTVLTHGHSSGQHALPTHSHSSGQHAALTHPAPAPSLEQAAALSSQTCSTASAVRQAAAGSAAAAGAAVQGVLEAGRGSAVPHSLVPPAWAQLPPVCPPSGAAAAAPSAAVNVFSRRPGNSARQDKPGRSSLYMFTGVCMCVCPLHLPPTPHPTSSARQCVIRSLF